ncbi:MAG TPA: hypothetical protein DCZ48_02495 [Methylococcaceae bacterium]|nr:hypothetical protein [Methylococcaceae bacterium]
MQRFIEPHSHQDRVFRLRSDVSLIFRQWDDEAVIFDINSGNTLLLDETAAYVLRKIEKAPKTGRQLECLVADSGGVLDHHVNDYLDRLISELQRLGLLEYEAIYK